VKFSAEFYLHKSSTTMTVGSKSQQRRRQSEEKIFRIRLPEQQATSNHNSQKSFTCTSQQQWRQSEAKVSNNEDGQKQRFFGNVYLSKQQSAPSTTARSHNEDSQKQIQGKTVASKSQKEFYLHKSEDSSKQKSATSVRSKVFSATFIYLSNKQQSATSKTAKQATARRKWHQFAEKFLAEFYLSNR
jgi:hypothetical protein